MNYLEAVNQILVDDGIIRGDDDAITSFSDTQHVANIRWAKRAVEQELNHLRAHFQWEGNRIDGSVATTALVRTYSLGDAPGSFVRFDEERPWLLKINLSGDSLGRRVMEYPGGLEALRREVLTYQEQTGDPIWWYWDTTHSTTDKRIGFYPIPDDAYLYRYWYLREFKSWTASESDELPFKNEWEAEAFVMPCVERFKYLRLPIDQRNALYPNGVVRHPALLEAESTLMALLNPKPARTGYGRVHRG